MGTSSVARPPGASGVYADINTVGSARGSTFAGVKAAKTSGSALGNSPDGVDTTGATPVVGSA